VRIYESRATPASVARMYDESLRAKGFMKAPANERSGGGGMYIRDDNAEIIVSITATDERTTVAIVEAATSPSQGVRVEVK
jgi:hypothetical protein